MALTEQQIAELWDAAIRLAERSRKRKASCPRVGALVADFVGKNFAEGSHDEGVDDRATVCKHAEQVLIEKLNNPTTGLPVRYDECYFFTTLEPCNERSNMHIPCAQRIGTLNFNEIHIGIMDPDPEIYGQGVSLLIQNRGADKVRYAPRAVREDIIVFYRDYIKLKEERYSLQQFEKSMPFLVGDYEEEKYLRVAYAFSKMFQGKITWLYPRLPSFSNHHKFQAWWAQGVFENNIEVTMILHKSDWEEGLLQCQRQGMKDVLLEEAKDRSVRVFLTDHCLADCSCKSFRGAIFEENHQVKYLINTIYHTIFDKPYNILLVCQLDHLGLPAPLQATLKKNIDKAKDGLPERTLHEALKQFFSARVQA